MGIKRYTANADTTITNAYKADLTTRGTGSNMGRADSMAIFSIYGQESSGSSELSRALLRFSTDTMYSDRVNGRLPASGSVSFYLRMFNAVTPFTVPRDFVMSVSAVSATATTWNPLENWQEGNGVDMENYTDITRGGIGANWMNVGSGSAAGTVTWENAGGDYHTDTSSSFSVSFVNGTEDLELDITTLVEQWMTGEGDGGNLGTKKNYGIGVHLSSSYEAYVAAADATSVVPANADGARRSYYTKKFFARSSEFFFKRPIIEARWDSAKKDDRGTFYYSSSLATAAENLNALYLYNYFRGGLRNIPDLTDNIIYVSFRSGSADNTAPSGSELVLVKDDTHVADPSALYVTGGLTSTTGIYTASVALTAAATPLTTIFDIWSSGAGGTEYYTGSFEPSKIQLEPQNPSTTFVSNITNLKPTYRTTETTRFRVFTRNKEWYPNIYTKAVATVRPFIVESGSFAVTRVIDGVEAVPFGTGSDMYTQMSFDASGSYFDLDMSMLQPGYAYKINLAYYNGSIGDWQEQPQEFKFRVEE